MQNLKCKICGGSLVPLTNGDLKCDSCGAVVKKADLETRRQTGLAESAQSAQELREKGEFSSAYSLYENILTQNPQDAEARWNLVLCRYGVLYQHDELTGESLPTVNRMRYDSILEDPDYRAALDYASKTQKDTYSRVGRQIADIQKRYLAIAEREQPYDVFISFKAENADGTRSRDSVIGQEIYNRLTELGLRAFYSRITLENKGGEEFEPYIFSALNTAKVMLLIGTDPGHVRAPWVANEWQRYLTLMQEKADKSLLPVYEGMELSSFPKGIPTREAVDYAKQGALSDLVQGVLSITGKGMTVEAKDSRTSIAKLTDGLRQSVEQGDFAQAKEIANAVLDLDAENSDAYFYLLLAYYRVKKVTALSDVDEPWTENRNYIRALKYADPARKQLLEAVKQRRDMRLEDEKNNRIKRAEAERREQELAKSLEEGRQKIQAMDYKGAFQVLTKNAAGNQEGDKLIEVAKKGMEARELLADKEFLDVPVKRDHPKDYFKMQRLKTRAASSNDDPPVLWLGCLILGAVLFFLAYIIGTSTKNGVPKSGIWDYVWMFLGPILMIVFLIVGIFFMVVSLVNLIRSLYGRHIRKAYETHMKEVIEPLRKAELERLKGEYEPWLGKAFSRLLKKNT